MKRESVMKKVTTCMAAAAALVALFEVASAEAAELKPFYDVDGNLVLNVVGNQKGDPRLVEVEQYVMAHIKPFINDGVLVNVIKERNVEMNKLHQRQLDTLDIAWLDRSDPYIIDSRMHNKASDWLREKVNGLNGGQKVGPIEEIFVFDDKGFNVAETDLTHDMNQGDETKYWKSFGSGPDGVVIEAIAPDGGFPHISQVSFAINDPATGKAIGAATIGINYDHLPKQ